MNREALSIVLVVTALSSAACVPDVGQVFETTGSPATGGGGSGGSGPGSGGGSTTTTTTTTSQGGSGGAGGTSTSSGTMTSTSSGTTMCEATPDGDLDGDGFTPNQGDCNDCDPEVNPNAIEIQGGPVDENCDGALDDKLATCDDLVAIDNQISGEVARALELCKPSNGEKDWGLAGSIWAMPDGSSQLPANAANFHLGHGVLPDFGPNVMPRAGKRLLALSSGSARRPGDPGFQNLQGFSKGYQSAPAPGFPKETVACGSIVSGAPNDPTALAVSIRVPSNVHGFSYDFSFYAYDFPQYVCSNFNDTFFAALTPQLAGTPDANIAYDEMGSPVTLNGANFRVCGCANGPPCMAGPKTYACDLGTTQLLGTGFGASGDTQDRGATGWLTTTVPVEPGSSISLRWGIYDAGDGTFDSTVLIDNWQWLTTPGVVLGTKIAD